MRTPRIIVPTLIAAALLVAACGSSSKTSAASDTTTASRTVQIQMQDNKYVPASVAVAAGETVKFVFTNDGSVAHDAFIGDEMAQADHEASMGDMSGHDMGDKNAITVASGKSGSLTHTFKIGDKLVIGCHEPGHYAGGMKLSVAVS